MMSAQGRSRLLIATLALPLLALVISALSGAHQSRTASRWTLPVEGYDPRDVLRGHYVALRYRLPEPVVDALARGDWLCLNGDPTQPRIGWASAEDRSGCAAAGRIIDDHDGFALAGFDRAVISGHLYMSEAAARRAEQQLRDAAAFKVVIVEVARNGRVTPVRLAFIEANPLEGQAAIVP